MIGSAKAVARSAPWLTGPTYEYEVNLNGRAMVVTPGDNDVLLRSKHATDSRDYILLTRDDLQFMLSVVGNLTVPVAGSVLG